MPGREGFETNREIAARYGNGGDVAPIVPVVTLPEGTTVDSPGRGAELGAALRSVQAALPDARLASYASAGDRAFVSEDGRTTFALVYVRQPGRLEPGQEEARRAQAALDGVTVGGAPVRVTGLEALRAAARATGRHERQRARRGPGRGAGALLVLAFVFASFMAMVPLLMAAVAIPTTFLLVWPLAEVTDVSIAVPVPGRAGRPRDRDRLRAARRHALAGGASGAGSVNEAAVRSAMTHAGSAVVFAARRWRSRCSPWSRFRFRSCAASGIAGLLIALVSVAVATTLLPVLLATVGPRLDWPRGRREDRASRAWTAWARFVVRHRWAAATASAACWPPSPRRLSIQSATPARRVARAVRRRARRAADSSSTSGHRPGGARALRRRPFDGRRPPTSSPHVAREWRESGARPPRLRRLAPRRNGARHGDPDPRTELRLRGARHWSGSGPSRARSYRRALHPPAGMPRADADFADAVYGTFPIVVALIAGPHVRAPRPRLPLDRAPRSRPSC